MEVNTGTESTREKNCPCMGVAAIARCSERGLGVGRMILVLRDKRT